YGEPLVIDPQTPSRLYLGSYEGLFETIDGGDNWVDTHSPICCVWSLAVDPQNSGTIYAGMGDLDLLGGFLVKSTNYGASWTTLNLRAVAFTSVALDPLTPSTIYVGALPSIAFGPGGIFRSNDGGRTWMNSGLTSGINDVRAIAIDPQNSSRIFISSPSQGVLKSTDGGASWSTTTPRLAGVASLVIDLHNSATVYA